MREFFKKNARNIVSGAFVMALAILILYDMDMTVTTKTAIIFVAAYAGPSIMDVLSNSFNRKDPDL